MYEKRVFYDRSDDANPYDGGYLYDIYSLYLNSNEGEDFAAWVLNKNPDHELYTAIYEDVVLEFNELKIKYGYANFDDLLTIMFV